jgi:hypothetical protein
MNGARWVSRRSRLRSKSTSVWVRRKTARAGSRPTNIPIGFVASVEKGRNEWFWEGVVYPAQGCARNFGIRFKGP